MKNKLLALILVFAVVIGAFAGLCLTTNAENTGESPNLFEMYGYNPSFDDGITPWTIDTGSGFLEQSDEDSADDDGYCASVSGRTTNFAVPRITGAEGLSLFLEQGAGTYYYSFYCKTKKKGATAMVSPAFQLCYGGKYSDAAAKDGTVVGMWPSDPTRKGFEVTNDKWTKIEMEVKVDLEVEGKTLAQGIIYAMERSFLAGDHAPDLLFDDFVLIKKDGGWVNVTPEPEVTIPSNARVESIIGPDKTQIGAVNYHMWFETLENWWEHDNAYAVSMDRNSVQEARSLSPAEYHFHLPFFAKINTEITSSKYITGDLSAGVAEFPEYTKEIWTKEMEYAIDAGIDFMAYTWTEKTRPLNGAGFTYHIQTKGLNGKIKMCAIIQTAQQDLNAMAAAAVEDYWYTIDGMPVVYIFGGKNAITEDLILLIRRKIAIAQYVKNGEVGKPAYIIGMSLNNYSTAVGVTSRGIDAVGEYAFGAEEASTKDMIAKWDAEKAKIRSVSYKRLAESAMEIMKDLAKVAKDGYAALSPCITLGYNTVPRMVNPVTWMNPRGMFNLPYGGYSSELPTAQEATEHVLEVLNFNKENRATLRTNTVLIYAWNEFNEGGWFCPTIKVDEKGNAIKNADGTNQINREYLDAVKKGIELYRKHEAEAAIYDVNDEKIKDIKLATPKPTETKKPNTSNAPSVTDAPHGDQDGNDNTNNNGNGWVLWVIIGGAVVVAAAAVVVVVIVLKKKKVAAPKEDAE